MDRQPFGMAIATFLSYLRQWPLELIVRLYRSKERKIWISNLLINGFQTSSAPW